MERNNFEKIEPIFLNNVIPIFMSVSNEFIPYFSVLLQSIIDVSSEEKNYDIIVLNKSGISNTNVQYIERMISMYKNISLRIYDTGMLVKDWKPYVRGHVTDMTYYRFLAPYIMESYDKAIYLDSDIVVLDDLAKLFLTDIEGNYLCAVKDAAAIGIYLDGKRTDIVNSFNNILKLNNPMNYFQAGMLIVNLKKFRDDFTLSEIMEICESGPWYFVDQDVLNSICQNHVTFIDMSWNVMTNSSVGAALMHSTEDLINEYNEARKNPKLIHFAGIIKPWDIMNSDFAYLFWEIARKTPFYEIIFSKALEKSIKALGNDHTTIKKSNEKWYYRIINILLPKNSKRRMYCKRIRKKLKATNG